MIFIKKNSAINDLDKNRLEKRIKKYNEREKIKLKLSHILKNLNQEPEFCSITIFLLYLNK